MRLSLDVSRQAEARQRVSSQRVVGMVIVLLRRCYVSLLEEREGCFVCGKTGLHLVFG
jgi:hypothetical protein